MTGIFDVLQLQSKDKGKILNSAKTRNTNIP